MLHHQILALFSLCIKYLFTTLFSRTSPRHFFSLPPTSLSPFSLTHIHSSLSSLSPLSVSGWRPSGSGTVIYVVWLFALNGMFYSVVGGSHWLCCRSPEPCIKKYVTHTHTYTHTHTRSKRMIFTDVFLLHFEHSNRKRGRQTDGDEDRMTGTYAADKESDAEKGNFCDNCRVNCCVRVCVWSQGHPNGLHFPPRCQTHNADSFAYELRAAEMEIGPTACLSVFLRVFFFAFPHLLVYLNVLAGAGFQKKKKKKDKPVSV